MESNGLQRRSGLEEKVPELERTISMVEMLQAKKVRPVLPLPLPSRLADMGTECRLQGNRSIRRSN
jgi:hypothetical protein